MMPTVQPVVLGEVVCKRDIDAVVVQAMCEGAYDVGAALRLVVPIDRAIRDWAARVSWRPSS